MFTRGRNRACRIAGVLGAALAVSALTTVPASSQGFFEMLFGGGFRRSAPPAPPPQVRAFVDPSGMFGGERRRSYGGDGDYSGGGSQAYCVRTCDGRYFPLQRHSGVSPADLCKSFCPASKTAVFNGSKIDYSVASNGTRYADLENAFVYRDRTVDNCTCNGKDPYGLVRVDLNTDPTLRPGDIVATPNGLATFRGKDNTRGAEFSPINPSALPGDWSRRLSALKITPVKPQEKVEPAPEETTASVRKDRRRVNLGR